MMDANESDLYAFRLELTTSPVSKAISTVIELGKLKNIVALRWIRDSLDTAEGEMSISESNGKIDKPVSLNLSLIHI